LNFVGETFFKESPHHVIGTSWSTADTTLATAIEHAKKFAGYQSSNAHIQAFVANWEAQPFFKHSPYSK
jgi:hypothetical protein